MRLVTNQGGKMQAIECASSHHLTPSPLCTLLLSSQALFRIPTLFSSFKLDLGSVIKILEWC